MIEQRIEKEAAEALLDIGVSLPFFRFKLPFFKKPIIIRLTMKRPCLGNQLALTRIYLQLGLTFEEIEKFNKHEEFAFMALHGKRLSQMIALTICRGAISGKLLSRMLSWLICWFVPREYLLGAIRNFVPLLGTRDFLPIIKSVQIANPTKLRMSQKRKGS